MSDIARVDRDGSEFSMQFGGSWGSAEAVWTAFHGAIWTVGTCIHTGMIFGALVNYHGEHWLAVVKRANALWHVDSCAAPRLLLLAELQTLLCRYPETYPLLDSCHPS